MPPYEELIIRQSSIKISHGKYGRGEEEFLSVLSKHLFVLLCVLHESKSIDHPGYWHSAVLPPASTLMVKPLLRFLGLGGVVLTGDGLCLPPGSTEQLFLGTLGRTTGAFGRTVVCLCPSAIRGGRVGMGPESTAGLDLWVGWRVGLEELRAPSSICSDPSLMGMGSLW